MQATNPFTISIGIQESQLIGSQTRKFNIKQFKFRIFVKSLVKLLHPNTPLRLEEARISNFGLTFGFGTTILEPNFLPYLKEPLIVDAMWHPNLIERRKSGILNFVNLYKWIRIWS